MIRQHWRSRSRIPRSATVSLTSTDDDTCRDTDTTSSVKVADIVIADDALGTNNLVLSGADAALFEIVGGNELHIKAGIALDFETNATWMSLFRWDDTTVGATPDDTAALAITVTDINEAPSVSLTNTTASVAEDLDTTTSVKVADIVITDDALGTNNLTLTGADAALFEIVGSELHIKAGTTLDFETNAALDVTVEVDDTTVGATPDDTAALAIAVSDANEAPIVSLTNTTTTLSEDTDTTSSVKVADIVIADDALGTNTLTLSGIDAALFEIVGGNELHIKAGTTLDFETNANLDVTVQVDDTAIGATPDDTAALAITVTDANEAPTVTLNNTTTTLAEDTDTTSSVKVADIIVADDALGTNTLTLSGADAALFEIVGGNELHIKAGTALDFETNANLDVTVQVDDTTVGATPDDTAALAIAVTDANEAPIVSLTNATTTLSEDADTTSSVKVADIVVADDALGTNTLTLSGTDAALFEIVGGNELHIKAGTALDFETNVNLDVTVQVDDAAVGATPDDTAALSIGVTDINEAPTVSLTNATTTLAEDTDTTSSVKVADIIVADDALGTNTLTLSGADAALFEIVGGNELHIKAGTTLDFETNANLDVTVQVDDVAVGATPDDTAALAITVSDANEAPTVSLSNTTSTLAEDLDTTTSVKVADIVITDDALGTNTLTLSGADAALFEIVGGNELHIKAGTALDFETNANLDVAVQVDDTAVGATPDDTAALTITVTNTNEAPTVTLSNTTTTLTEDTDTTSSVKVADIVVADDALGTNTLTLSGADAALFEIVGGNELHIKSGTALDFETNANLDVTVQVDDTAVGATPDDTAVLSISVTDINETPTVSLANTTTSLAEDADTTSSVKVADIVIADDALGANTLTFSGADAALFEIVGGNELHIKVGTALDFETNLALDVTVAVDDTTVGATPDDTAALAIAVTDTNEAPTVTLSNTTTTLAEDLDTTSSVKVADIVIADDALGANTLTLSGANAALFEIVGGNELHIKAGVLLDFETNPVLDVTIEINDITIGSAPDDAVAMAISITAVNNTPTLVNQSFTLAENSPNGFAVGTIAFTDSDTGDNHTFSITGGTGSAAFAINSATGELTVADNSALDFELNPALTLTVQITDNGTPPLSASATITINLTDVAEFDISALGDVDTTVNVVSSEASIGAPVGISVIADDADVNDTVTYSLDDAAGGLFAIDGASGVVTVNGPLDAQTTKSYSIVVRATSTDGSASTQAFDIVVQGANDNTANNVDPRNGVADGYDPEPISPPRPDITIGFDDGSVSYSNEDILVVPASNNEDRFERRRSGGGSSSGGADEAVSIVVETTSDQIDQVAPELADAFLIPTENAKGSGKNPILVEIKAPATQQKPGIKAALAVDSMQLNDVMADHALWERLEKMQQEMSDMSAEQEERELIVKIVTGSTLTVSAGFVSWILRGGTLLASFLSTLPLWKGFDPLPILATREKKSEEKQEPDTDANADKNQVAVDVLFQANSGQLNRESGSSTP